MLAGRLALVTGASTGIGAAIARALAARGAAVVGAARRFAARPASRPAAGALLELRLDVTDEAAVASLFAAVAPVDVLVCCAGVSGFAPVVDTAVAELRAMLDTHIVGTFLPARALLAARRPAHIVIVSSVAAFRTFTACGAYSAAKEGQRGLARVLVEEGRPYGVRVTALYPGATDTPIWDDRPGFEDRSAMLRPDDVAGLVADVVCRPALAVEELIVMPPAGAL